MKKIFVIGISVYAVGMTAAVIKSRSDILHIGEALTEVLKYLTQQRVDVEFALIVDDLNDIDD